MKTRAICGLCGLTVLLFGILTACAGPSPSLATATPERLLVEATLSPFPQIIRQSPLPGERLALKPTLEFGFDRPMQPDQTAAAWQFLDAEGQALAGKLEWADERTLRFTPQRSLQAGASYSGLFSTSALSAAGQTLAAAARFDYRVTDLLAVSQVFPLDQAQDVERGTAITVLFNKPVIPLMTKEDQAKLPPPISIQPALAGTGDWVSPSIYVFNPETGLASGTHYEVRVRPTLKDTTGVALQAEYSWGFTTSSPAVVNFALQDVGYNFSETIENVRLDQVFQVTFNQPMDQASLAGAVLLQNIETRAAVPVKFTWDETATVLTITPSSRLTIASFYNLTVAASALAQDGGAVREDFRIKLSTLPRPAISKVSPSRGSQSDFSALASVSFNTRMEFASMQDRVRVSPEPAVPVRLFYREEAQRLDIFGLEPSTEYVIRILPGISDIYGNRIGAETSFSFETAGLTPMAGLLTPYYPLIFRTTSDQSIFLEYTNLDSAVLSLHRLTFDQFMPLVSGSLSMNSFYSAEPALREWQPELLAGKNQFARVLLHLDESGPLAPGYYYLGLNAAPLESSERYWQGAIFIVADDNLTLKTTQTEALAWLVNSQSGRPVADVPVDFYDSNSNHLGSVVTDNNGLAYLQDAPNAWYARTADETQVAMAASNWGAGVNEGQTGVWVDYWWPVKETFVYIYTERPLYRPNQPVYIKGILRDVDDLRYRLTELSQVFVSIDGDQGQVFGEMVSLSEMGSFAAQFDLGADAPVGNYYIQVRSSRASDYIFGSTSFRVAEYVKPQFAVTASAAPATVLTGEEAVFALDAAYYSGGSLGNATVDWFMESQPFYYNPPAAYSAYSFDDFNLYDYYLDGGGSSVPPVFKDGQGPTDENGHFELVETLTLDKDSASQTINFSANVTDVGGNLVGSSASLTVLASAVHAGIRPENYVGEQGQPQTFELVLLDMVGEPLAGQSISVAFAEQRWYSVVREDENGVSRWESAVKTIPAGNASAITDANGLATVSFTPPTGGQYKATLTAKDVEGRAAKASAFLWVSSQSYVPWRQTNDRSFQLIADKDSYNPGDTAKILIAQPFEGQNLALITVERGHIYEKKVVTLENNSTVYELPITSDMAPVMYVSVVVVRAAQGDTPPDFKMGMVRVNISPARQGIFISLESDKATAQPGEAVTYTVHTKDLDGKPVQADVSLALVDQAALALAPSVSLPLLEAFYPQRGLSVMTASSLVLNAEEFNTNYEEIIPDGESSGSGGGGGKGEGETGIVTVRQNFKDTAFWQAQVLTDEKGLAQVTLTLPDNLTTWQMTARAVTKDTRVGETESELLSTRPLQIDLQTPRFFVVDDVLTLGALVHNNTEQSLQVKVTLEAEGLNLESDASQMLTVAARQQAYATWQVTVQRGVTRVDLVASAASGSYSDSTRPTLGTLPGQGLPVLAYHVIEMVGSAGALREAGSIAEAVSLPASLDYLDAALNLEVSPSLAASMLDGLDYLNDYPYLCMEQTVSRFLPNLIALEALKLAGKPTDSLQIALDEQVRPALQRLISNQGWDGGWGLWPGSESQPNTTAYVVLGLLEAQKAGYTVSETVLDNGLGYLNANLPSISRSSTGWQKNRTAFALYALARGGLLNANGLSSLYAYRVGMNYYAKGLLMQAMHLNDPADERILELLSEINGAAAQSAAGAWWDESETDYWNWNTDLRTTAILLNALIQVDPQNALIPNGIRWLMKHRSGSHWYSTQETAWSLMALTNWLALSGEFETDYAYAIGLNGELLESGQARAEALTETTLLRLDAQKLVAEATNSLVITRGAGPGVLYYTAYMEYALPVEDISALDQGILVSRQYYRPDDLKTPVTTVERGELVQARITVVVPESVHYLVIDDPLPAGLEAIDASLLTSQQVPLIYQPNDYERYGWGWWYFYYKQIYDDRVVMSADYLPAGTYTITYLARANTKGQFHVLPVTARQFYFPDVAGRSAGSMFEVK